MTPLRGLAIALPALLLLPGLPSRSDDRVATLGKQRAAAAQRDWEIRDASHPILGPIRFAHTTSAVQTPVGNARVFSNAYVSCEKAAGTIAIELTNQTAPDDPGGLRPATMPRLVCMSPAGPSDSKRVVEQLLEASWQVNPLGDAMARGFRPSALRACTSIAILENVALPQGWARASVPVRFEIAPYDRGLDSIFVACGEASAYAPARPAPAKAIADRPWKTARTIASGHTNVRAEPNVHSAVVARLDPGAVILVQRTGGEWWRAKSRGGAKFEGYIREDRLAVRR